MRVSDIQEFPSWRGRNKNLAHLNISDKEIREWKKAKKRAYMRAYFQRPDVKAKKRAYMRAYFQRPGVKAKRRAYWKRYYRRNRMRWRRR